ncbi:hypothetical protein H8B02_30670 [Bradyrhizobium sp. Pear77]|uniref:hypothetical protein n=1 Tax=Bradyrhizobium altum TaxID=1571202 RepID=UPI001E2A1F19|nr:hypothetical protein [Bradyrhizobium altum]MCC8957639.1 hypothetical protein [Bradyrhizobium altum]
MTAASAAIDLRQQMPVAARMIADYDDFIAAVRARADEMNLSRNEIDNQTGLTSGYV